MKLYLKKKSKYIYVCIKFYFIIVILLGVWVR